MLRPDYDAYVQRVRRQASRNAATHLPCDAPLIRCLTEHGFKRKDAETMDWQERQELVAYLRLGVRS